MTFDQFMVLLLFVGCGYAVGLAIAAVFGLLFSLLARLLRLGGRS